MAHSIVAGYLKLDGRAMFGVVPKVLWEKLTPPDERNQIRLAMRALLFQSRKEGQKDGRKEGQKEGKWCLVDCGTGDKWDEKRRDMYGLEQSETTLVSSLARLNLRPEDISYMLESHLHFDHNGGLTRRDRDQKLVPTFPNATHFIHRKHWEHALSPHERDQASFFKEDFEPLKGQVPIHWVEGSQASLLDGQVQVFCVHGHTPHLMVFDVSLPDSPVQLTYASDMVPTASHVRVPYVMGYDLQPAVMIQEKKGIYERLAKNEHHYLFLEHDESQECIRVTLGEKGWTLAERKQLGELVGE